MMAVAGLTWAVLALYLALFFLGTRRAAPAAGQPVWLFGQARGRDRLAAIGFRAAFALAVLAPLLPGRFAGLPQILPPAGLPQILPLTGLGLALSGAGLALWAQHHMGASWRVGVIAGQTGALVSGGPFRFSRNPAFAGQALLLAGMALVLPGPASLLALPLFLWSARTQIRSEEAALLARHGATYAAYMAQVPRWLIAGRAR